MRHGDSQGKDGSPSWSATHKTVEGMMACACVKAGKETCAWCKEAIAHNMSVSKHKCQWGSCS